MLMRLRFWKNSIGSRASDSVFLSIIEQAKRFKVNKNYFLVCFKIHTEIKYELEKLYFVSYHVIFQNLPC
jgi:hypothetical protein